MNFMGSSFICSIQGFKFVGFQVDAQDVDVGLEKEGTKLHLEFTKFLQIFIVGGYTQKKGQESIFI